MRYNIIKKISKNILIICMIFICFVTQTIYIKAEKNDVVKVGYPIVEGFTEINDGVYSGYVYEYLGEIAKYTGWEYEFVEMSLNGALNALKDGKIDIVAGMIKNDATMELFDFPEYDIGSTYTTLSTLKDNEKISKSNYETIDGIKIGYYETSKASLDKFTKFCEENNINNVELISYPHEEGLLNEKLKSKEVDAIIEGDLLLDSEEKVVAKFGATPYYLATTKGNKKIVSGLNESISKIRLANPNFSQVLYNKYFQSNNDYSFSLTKEEKEYIKNTTKLKAIYIEDYKPLQYYDSNTKEAKGIFIDNAKLIFKKLGIELEFVKVKSYEDAYKMIRDKKADLIVGVPSVYQNADENGIKLTTSYLNLDMVRVVRKGDEEREDKKVVALARGYGYSKLNENDEVRIYDTIEECINAVNEGKVDMAYGNEYALYHYITAGYYPSLNVIIDEETIPASIGLSKSADKELLSIINKAMYTISNDNIQSIIYKNTMSVNHDVTLKQFFFDNIALCVSMIVVILSIITIMIFIIVRMRFRRIREAKEILFRKTQIDSLTEVYNREASENLIEKYLYTKDPSLYGVFIIIDIDYFKQVNDYLGHKIGDNVLIEFAKLLKQFFSYEDVVSRIGGDEFVIFMKDIEESNLYKVDEKLKALCSLMDKEVTYNGSSQKISISMGAIATKKKASFGKLYQMADEMLYETKRNGKNGFRIKNYN